MKIKKQLFKPVLTLTLLWGFNSSNAQNATTVSLTGSSSTNTITNNVATIVDAALVVTSDGNITDFTVMITGSYASGDMLDYTGSLPSGVSAGSFNTTSRSLKFTGTTSASNWQALLRTVRLKTTSASCYQEQRQVSFMVGAKFLNNLNGHFYELSSSSSNWSTGVSNAATQSYFGRLGYMATITSQAENSFISKILGSDSWVGGSDDYTYINAATGASTFANQSASEGRWYWVTGPEKGTNFSNGNNSPSLVSGQYMNWASGEPNNSGSEHYLEIYVAFGNWNDLNNSNSYRTVIEYGGTSTDNVSSSVVFTRNLLISGAVSGSVTGGNTSVCAGTNSTTLTLTGMASGGSVVRWEYSYDDFLTSGVPISNTTTTNTATNITQNTYYRAVVNAGGCTGLATSSTYILATAAVAGNIVGDNTQICTGNAVNFTLNGYTGTINKWQVSTTSNFSSGVTDISNTTSALNYTLSSVGTYYFRAEISSCSNTVYTNTFAVTVIAGSGPVGGSVGSISLCGTNSGTLTLSGYTGTVTKWQLSTDGGVVWSDISNTTNTLSFSGVTATRRYRALVTNGSCGSVFSSEGIITVLTAPVAGTATGGGNYCSATNSTNLSLSGNTGSIQWQSSTNNSTFNDISGATSANYTATNLGVTTYFRAKLTIGSCSVTTSPSLTVTVTVTPAISVTPNSSVYTGGVSTNLYLGYGPTAATLSTGAGNVVTWSPSTYLSCTSCSSTVFTPTAAGNYTITATNCGGSKTVIFCVKDIRVAGTSGSGLKVYIFHEDNLFPKYGKSEIQAVLARGISAHMEQHKKDKLGNGSYCASAKRDFDYVDLVVDEQDLEVTCTPNPFRQSFKLNYLSNSDLKATVTIYGMTGNLIESRTLQSVADEVELGQNLTNGIYTVSFIQGDKNRVFRMIKVD